MALNTTYAPVREAGNDVKVDFDFDFEVLAASDLSVGKILNSTNVKTTLTLGVDYTVTLNAVTRKGTVHYTVAPTSLQDSWIGRAVPTTQPTDIPTNNIFREVQVENSLDRQAMISQQLEEQIGRAVLLPETSSLSGITLPEPEDGLAIVWDGTSGALKNAPVDAGAIATGIAAAEAAQAAAETAQSLAETAQTAAEAAAAAIDDYASQAQAEAGLAENVVMNPLRTAQAIAALGVQVDDWTDYSAISTITGFSTVSNKVINVKKVDKIVFVEFFIEGTSNATGFSFTLPYANASAYTTIASLGLMVDNSGTFTPNGCVAISAGASTAVLYRTLGSSTSWTASGTKYAYGQFFYKVA